MRIQHPISHYLLYLDFEVLLKEINQWESLSVKGLVVKHYLDKSETILCLFSDFKLSLAKPALHEALKIVNLEGLTVLLVWEVEKADYGSLLARTPYKALGDLIYFQVYAFFVLVFTEGQYLIVHSPIFHWFLLDQGTGQYLLAGVVLLQAAIEAVKLRIPFTKLRDSILPLSFYLCIKGGLDNRSRECDHSYFFFTIKDSLDAVVLCAC